MVARVRSRFSLVATLFLVSGATGLLYEVAFSKLLAYIFGATAYAVSTVLASFMGGLALGAHFGGKNAARAARPLMVYGALEVLVGLVCAATPGVFALVTSAYVALAHAAPGSLAAVTAARAALTALVVVIPTVAMGATLPLLSRVIARSEGDAPDPSAGRRLAGLYAINTAGGAFGALASAYTILPLLGVRGTMRAAALANIAIGVIAFLVGRGATTGANANANDVAAPTRRSSDVSDAKPLENERLLLTLAAASGFLVFAAEVVQTHLLALLIGNSAYAFGLMLAVFLVCLSVGAARTPAFARRHGPAALSRGLAFAAIALAATLPLWDQLPRLFLFAGKYVSSWGGREICRALAALAILVLPTLWMGSTFPLLLERIANRSDVASRVGRLTVANTLGTIAGSILTGYLLLPALGSQRALAAVAVAFAVASLAAARGEGVAPAERTRSIATAAAAVALALLLPKWDMARLTSGANVYFTVGPPPDSIDFVREDVHGGVTTVVHRGPVTTMYTNGKFQGDNGLEMNAQRRFAHFPSLFVDRFDRALVIGLGTGTTLGTIAAYPWQRIDVAEISPAIVEASRRYFADQSFHALDDPRVHLDLNDGRNVLLVANEPYDLVTIELTSVWFAGAASLYSHEFYELVRARLAPTGILQQWVQLHHIRRRELATIVRTLRGVFPHVALFVGGAQGILVAGSAPLVASKAHLHALEERPALRATLDGKHFEDLFAELVASGPELDRFVAESAEGDQSDEPQPISTDDNLYLEYATPKGNVLNYDASLEATLSLLNRYRESDAKARHLGE
jgi:spermidine synthase